MPDISAIKGSSGFDVGMESKIKSAATDELFFLQAKENARANTKKIKDGFFFKRQG